MSYCFCPICGNLLLIDTLSSQTQLKCRSCNFAMLFQGQETRRANIAPLDVAAFVSSGDENIGNKINAKCEKCGHNEAYMNEVQIRSADEPTTLFFVCCSCRHNWREG
jgi:DNA-directed RNA polymerase III subunit RPC11